MSKRPEPAYISAGARAALHFALARAADAGMAADLAVSSAVGIGERDLDRRLTAAGNSIRKGQSYTAALMNQGLLTRFDLALLTAGENAGNIGLIQRLLYQRYDARNQRHSRLRGRMTIPVATTLLALFINPLPGLTAASLTLFQYLLRSVGVTMLLIIIWLVCRQAFRRHEINGWPPYTTRILTKLPALRRWLATSARAAILENLAILMEAGVPAQQALTACADSAADDYSRKLAQRARNGIGAGEPVAQSLAGAGLLDEHEGYAIVSTGEAAGKLTESLQHQARANRERTERAWDQFCDWTPRIVYAVVVVLILKDIFIMYSAYISGMVSL